MPGNARAPPNGGTTNLQKPLESGTLNACRFAQGLYPARRNLRAAGFLLSGADLVSVRANYALRGATLKANGATLKANGATLKARAATLKARAATLKARAATLKANGATLEAERGANVWSCKREQGKLTDGRADVEPDEASV